MIQAKVVADSKNEFGNRITTMVVTFPRIILAEFNTHRMFSRNSASSRAIPFEKMLKSVEENPFIPIAWQKDHKGMQGTEYLEGHDADVSRAMWLEAKEAAVEAAKNLADNAATKQLCNRLLEPFMWHTVIVTATEWENFFALRCPQYQGKFKTWRSWKEMLIEAENDEILDIKDYQELANADILYKLKSNKGQAEIHMMALAEAMWDAYNESTPKELKAGEWHIPFGDNVDIRLLANLIPHYQNSQGEIESNPELELGKIKVAVARCARVSYTVVGEENKDPNYENDIKLHDRLLEAGHMSPFEHCARAMSIEEYNSKVTLDNEGPSPMISNEGISGNFVGFVQYRKLIKNENRI